ncbi:dihydrolipoamide acetyltransferase family protein [Solicola sp. PLA-1-18]|uniref:dihydrolipoamide acetyltransferase family protein n=1 Tax=Solicola sp. PLA-1-18 TaxID=3380532 RepID=UPI003B7A61A3
MSQMQQFNLPDVGEGLTEAEIVSWSVKPGDVIEVNDVVVEIETAKSVVELPSPYAGTVARLLVDAGETVAVGTPIIAVAPAGVDVTEDDAAAPAEEEPMKTLVGYGPRASGTRRRPRKAAPSAPTEEVRAEVNGAFGAEAPLPPAVVAATTPVAAEARTAGTGADAALVRALAKPPVRKLAKDLGVDLSTVTPSGPGGVVTRADVESHGSAVPAATPPVVQARTAGGQTRVPVKGVRKMTAQAMVGSAFTAPHVTEWLTVDVTRTVELVDRLKADRAFADVKVSPLLVLAKAVCLAARRTPELNARWDEAAQEIVLEHDVNLGIAAATPRGLVVPNVKGAQALGLHDLAAALGTLVATAREGRTQPAEMSGGTFTITNVGVFGVDAGTPILNPGEAGILAFGQIRRMPWVVDGPDGERIEPRSVCTLALSFDHRVADGEQGSRFLADVGALLHDPANALLY